MRRFDVGEPITWRNCVRIDRTGTRHPSFASAMRVVRDDDDLVALYRGPGYPLRRRNAEGADVPSFRHQPVIGWREGWRGETWERWRVLVLKEPTAEHAVSLFWDDKTNALDFWYIDLIGPVSRTRTGFDFPENGLDIVIEPDWSSWRWKDVDELEWEVQAGRYSRVEVDDLRAEGRRAVERLFSERPAFERWSKWRPNREWRAPTFPDGWDEVR
jgi:hypothetical protein